MIDIDKNIVRDALKGLRAGTTVQTSVFGELENGSIVHNFTLEHITGVSVTISEFGSALTSIQVPDRHGNKKNVILNYPTLDRYVHDPFYLGVLVGRYANRIAHAQFRLNGTTVSLSGNSGEHHLHGGFTGFGKRLWTGKVLEESDHPAVMMSLLSDNEEEGYPGQLQVYVVYSLVSATTLEILMKAVSDSRTVVNLTQHPYFNLTGKRTDISEHYLQLFSDKYLPVHEDLIPIGMQKHVDGTVFDFRESERVGSRLETQDAEIAVARGFDHCWVLRSIDDQMQLAATVYEETSGRKLRVFTDAPGIQFYSGNHLHALPGMTELRPHSALCLEPQSWPDSPNQPDFPSTILNPGEVYTRRVRYQFDI